MRVLLRADASPVQGTGHVMRCLTLSEALRANGHEAILMTNDSTIPWLEDAIRQNQILTHRVQQLSLNLAQIRTINPDWVVFDTYEIDAADISDLTDEFKTLAIIDGDARGILADLYLDHNIGAEGQVWPNKIPAALLAGIDYCLIRDSVLQEIHVHRGENNKVPHIVSVMGGSDPTGAILEIAQALNRIELPFTADLIAPQLSCNEVQKIMENNTAVRILPTTPELPKLLGAADIVISAAGTSSWELCTLGKPSLLIAVVENQVSSLERLKTEKLILGIDSTGINRDHLSQLVYENLIIMLGNPDLREKLSENCRSKFDGLGKYRVVAAMENFLSQ